MTRSFHVAVVGVPATVWYGIRAIRAARRGGADGARECAELPRSWARLLLRLARVDVRLENAAAIDPRRSQVLVANHTSWFDVLALAAHLPGPYLFIAKKELASVPVFGPAWLACGHISVDRQDRERAIESLERASRRLRREAATVVVFPEGTRSPDGELRAFKKGAFVLAIQAGADVVPAAILGSRDVMRKGGWTIRPGTVTVRFGEPLPVAGLSIDERDALRGRAWEAVAALRRARS